MRFSIITVTYNAAATLEGTLRSVLIQSYPDVEYIVVDGASTDGTQQIAERYLAPTDGYRHAIARFISEPDGGIYYAMNKGIALATGDYLLFLNAGDRLHRANVLEQLSRAIERSATTHGVMPPVVYGETELIDAQGHDLGPRRLHTPDTLTWRSFRRGMVVCHQSFLVLRTYALRHPYNLSYRYSADQDWCIRIMKQAQQDLPDTPAKHVLLNSRTLISDYLNEGTTTRHHRDSLRERFVIYRHHYGLLTTLLCHVWFLLRAAFK